VRIACAIIACCAVAGVLAAEQAQEPRRDQATLLVVAGAEGEAEFAGNFEAQVATWSKVGAAARAKTILVGAGAAEGATDHDRIKEALAAETKDGNSELWLVLVGHGTFDGKEAKFNLRGPDVSASELADWLKPFKRPIAIIDTSSASAPFLVKLTAPKRAVVTSTRSGYEQNFSRFGKYFAEAIADPRSDLDKDGQISLLEAFLSASTRTNEFYKTEGRLATEHALIDDNGDGLGTPADWFRGVRAIKRARDGAALDGARAQQFSLVRSANEQRMSPEVRAQRDKLELRLAELREQKAKMKPDDYYREVEKVLLDLAALYDGS
jgi:hypothetical protein